MRGDSVQWTPAPSLMAKRPCEEVEIARPALPACKLRNVLRRIYARRQTNGFGHNPVGVGFHLRTVTQGSSFLATLGWRTQSLWDCSPRPSRIHAIPPKSFS